MVPVLILIYAVMVGATSLNISLEAPWKALPFAVQLIESYASANELWYQPIVEKIVGVESDDTDDDDDYDDLTDEELYNRVSLGIDPSSKALVDLHLVYKMVTPRILAHYQHFAEVEEYLKSQCTTDSFGNTVDGNSWVVYNNKVYCSPDDLYAIQTEEDRGASPLAFDRVIGDESAPLLVLYGDGVSESFKEMLRNLYLSARDGKLRFVWRYVPVGDDNEVLPGYGVDLTLKRTDYLTVESLKKKKSQAKNVNFVKDPLSVLASDEIRPVESDIALGYKLTKYVLSQENLYEALRLVLENFPKYAHHIGHAVSEVSDVKRAADYNEEMGASEDSNGLYINGATVDKDHLDIHVVISALTSELSLIQELQHHGLSITQAKRIIFKFALLSAVKETQFRQGNTLMGENENRFQVYKHSFYNDRHSRGGVVFFNDIENDKSYEFYEADRQAAYLNSALKNMPHGQLPALRENVHDLILAINFGHKEQLRVFFTVAKFFLDQGIPKQVGVLPLIGFDPRDERIAQVFYFLAETTDPKEALALLYKILEAKSEEEETEILNQIPTPPDQRLYGEHRHTAQTFSLEQPSVIMNGVVLDMQGSEWQKELRNQVAQDVRLLQYHISKGSDKGKKLKDILYANAKMERNLRVIPKDPATKIYKKITTELIDHSFVLRNSAKEGHGTFWLIGDANLEVVLKQLALLVQFVADSNQRLQIRVINTSSDSLLLEKLTTLGSLTKANAAVAGDIILAYTPQERPLNETILSVLERNSIQLRWPSLLFSLRYFRLEQTFDSKELALLVEFETKQRLSIIKDTVDGDPELFALREFPDFNKGDLSDCDWYDVVTSVVTKSFYVDVRGDDVARFDFYSLNANNSIAVTDYERPRELDVLAIIDPLEEKSQKIVAILNAMKDLPFVNVRLLLQPRKDAEIRRFYRGVFPSAQPEFVDGRLKDHTANFVAIPGELLTTDIDAPQRWIVTAKKANVDLDNVQAGDDDYFGVFQLKHILVEGAAFDIKYGSGATGLELELYNEHKSSETSVMAWLGYFQLRGQPGTSKLRLKPGSNSEKHCAVLSAGESKFSANTEPIVEQQVEIFSLEGRQINVRIQKNPEFEGTNLLTEPRTRGEHADINVFSIASGKLYERLLSIMMASVRAHTKQTIKFWIIENYVSPELVAKLPVLASTYDFDYELITYRWPAWLRPQREKQRTIWGYKILFLDVIFPQDLDKVIFVDADSIVRADLQGLIDLDLEGAPYGFTPMCDSRKEMDGFRFWKEGYWTEVLEDQFKYHISALYVVDLNKFRSVIAGDRLRSHYQNLSKDPNSLANLDQDLPNNMQRWIKIHSLPQEWLWCETWCDDASLSTAKVVDLCNNPLTKENKVTRAKRLIPEWSNYDKEVTNLDKKSHKVVLDEL